MNGFNFVSVYLDVKRDVRGEFLQDMNVFLLIIKSDVYYSGIVNFAYKFAKNIFRIVVKNFLGKYL